MPVLVKRHDGPLPGFGPFTEVSSLTVFVLIEGYTAADVPASIGSLVQPSPTAWELGTVINLGTLPNCGADETKRGSLTVS